MPFTVFDYALLGSCIYREVPSSRLQWEVGERGMRSFNILQLIRSLAWEILTFNPGFLIGVDDRANIWKVTMSHGSHSPWMLPPTQTIFTIMEFF